MDDFYPIEIKIASKNGWFTPDEARAYYGRYARTGITVHWWGDGTGASNHDNIVNYMNNQAALGNKSVNYVLSDNKITLCVSPDNVAWASQSGNATEISVETQPTLGAEGYKKWGWLKWQLEQRYGRTLELHPHSFWYPTACPGTISLDRIQQEYLKWKNGGYNPQPAPAPAPAPVPIATVIPQVKKYTLANAKLVNIKDLSVVKTYPLDTEILISGSCNWNGKDFLLSGYAMLHDTMQGFLVGDLKDAPTPPLPTPTPAPVQPEWVAKAQAIAATTYYVTEDTNLLDITTGQPVANKTFKKGDEFIGAAMTSVGGVEYRLTNYSYTRKVWNGLPMNKLSLTNPLVVPPVPPLPQTLEERVAILEKLVAVIRAALAKIGITI